MLVKIVTEILFWLCTFGEAIKQLSWQQITDQRTKKQDRDIDHAHAMGRDRTRVGGSTDASLSFVSENGAQVCTTRPRLRDSNPEIADQRTADLV